jgi:hypothetical protein
MESESDDNLRNVLMPRTAWSVPPLSGGAVGLTNNLLVASFLCVWKVQVIH